LQVRGISEIDKTNIKELFELSEIKIDVDITYNQQKLNFFL